MTLTVLPPASGGLHHVRFGLMTAVARQEGTRTVVVLRGEADVSTARVPSDVLSWVIAWRTGDVVVDLGELKFIDSATVHILAEAQQLLEHAGRAMSFRSPSRLATRVLQLFGLTGLIEVGDLLPRERGG
jgi:anti-anti-sigma factor